MQQACAVLRRSPGLAPVLTCVATVLLSAAATAAVQPFTRLYDAPAETVSPLSKKDVMEKRGWTAIRESDTAHCFQGAAVLMNDKIVAVLRGDTSEVDLYSRQTAGLKRCARLQPLGRDGTVMKRTSLTIRKNTPDGITLEVTLESPGNAPCHVAYGMTVGGAFVRTTAAGVAHLRVHAPCRFAVMPDFFGDDIVVDAEALPVGRAELPGENFLMHMLHGGEAILMTVSASRQTDVGVTLSQDRPRRIVRSDIAYGKPDIWVAVLAGQGIWHQRTVAPADAGKILKLDWRMPFPALWRVDWRAADGLTDSWQMWLQHPEGKYVMLRWFGEDAGLGQDFGEEFGPRDWNKPGRKRWNPVLGSFAYPCWVDRDGRGYLQPLTERRYVERGEVCNFDGPAILYPLDRVREPPFRTPIERLTVVDLVRMTLGVGPCQYILDLEGQKRQAEGVATCYARDVINAIYKEGTQLQNGPVIEKHLDAAVAFIRNVRERIDEYVAFGRRTAACLRKQKRQHPEQAPFCDELLAINARLGEFFESRKERIHTPEYAEQVARDFRRELLTDTWPDAYEKCKAHMKIITGIGGAQDGLVASCRMIVKTLRQRCGIAMTMRPEVKALATELRGRTRKMLRNPTAYEAPQH
ncbi:MAG: hypothetical protein R6X20_14190 [Phycisphaerae bacterium]